MKKKSLSEKDIQRQILDLLKYSKIEHARINSGDIYTGKYKVRLAPAGFPDIIFFLNGVHAIEVKREGLDIEPEQEKWKKIFTTHASGYLVATSVESVVEYLARLRRKVS